MMTNKDKKLLLNYTNTIMGDTSYHNLENVELVEKYILSDDYKKTAVISFTYNKNHEQICDKLGYKCPSAITATIESCKGCQIPKN